MQANGADSTQCNVFTTYYQQITTPFMVIVPLEEVLIICQSGTLGTPMLWFLSFQTLQNYIIHLTCQVNPGVVGYPCTPGFFMRIFWGHFYFKFWQNVQVDPGVIRPSFKNFFFHGTLTKRSGWPWSTPLHPWVARGLQLLVQVEIFMCSLFEPQRKFVL